MNKRISQKKINGEIILKQTQLMNKLATIDLETKPHDELGFLCQPPREEQDALLSLISKSKDIVPLPLGRPARTASRSTTSRRCSSGSPPRPGAKQRAPFSPGSA